jgi:hypothetical protein
MQGIICYSREPETRFRAKSPVNSQVTNSQSPRPKAQSPTPSSEMGPGAGSWRMVRYLSVKLKSIVEPSFRLMR